MDTNLTRGKPYRSRFRDYLPEAVALRKAGGTWAGIAARLSEMAGEPVPVSTLHDAVTRWIRRRSRLDALPDPGTFLSSENPSLSGFSKRSEAVPPKESVPAFPAWSMPTSFSSGTPGSAPPPWSGDLEDEPSRGPVIRINRSAKSSESSP